MLQPGNTFVLLSLILQPRPLDAQGVAALLCAHGLHSLTLMDIMKRVRKFFGKFPVMQLPYVSYFGSC